MSKEEEKNLILSYAKLIPSHSGFLGTNYLYVLKDDPETWGELLLNNSSNTSLLTAGARFIPMYNEDYILKIFQKINQNLKTNTGNAQEDINFFNKKIIKNPYLSIDLIQKLINLETSNKINLTKEVKKLLKERVKFDSKTLVHIVKTQKNKTIELEILLDKNSSQANSVIELDDLIVEEILENYEKIRNRKNVTTYLESIKYEKVKKLVADLEEKGNYLHIEYLAKERKGIARLVSNQKELAQIGCGLGWVSLKESRDFRPEIREYVILHYSKVKDLLPDLTYGGLIVERIEKEPVKISEYAYKLLPEWNGSLHDLLKASSILVK